MQRTSQNGNVNNIKTPFENSLMFYGKNIISHLWSMSNYKILKGGSLLYKKYEELLLKTGETSYQVSKETGIGQNTLSNWKTGRSKPKVDKLKKLAEHFGVPIDYFLE